MIIPPPPKKLSYEVGTGLVAKTMKRRKTTTHKILTAISSEIERVRYTGTIAGR
jgi:hypothetical protein